MNLLGEKRIKIRPLNDNKAIEKGANFLSEFFIFSVAGSLIMYESYRSRKKTNLERTTVQDDIALLQDEIVNLQQGMDEMKEKLASRGVLGVDSSTVEHLKPQECSGAKDGGKEGANDDGKGSA